MTEHFPATIARPVDHELVIKKSRFLTHIAPVDSPENADAVIAAIKKQAWDARHHCSAQVTGIHGDRARSSDDGEPAGTAGMPMLEVLRRRELTDVVAVVTRYFGGVKLGAGGLIRAYSTAASEALDRAELVDRRALAQVTMRVPHADAGRFENFLREWTTVHDAVLEPTRYESTAIFEVWADDGQVPALQADIASLSGGAVQPMTTGERRIVNVPRRVQNP